MSDYEEAVVIPDKPKKPRTESTKYAKVRLCCTEPCVLDTFSGILREAGRIYRLTLNGRISMQDGARLQFQLGNIRQILDAKLAHEREYGPRLIGPPQQSEPTIVLHTVAQDCYLTAAEVARIRAVEHNNAYGNGQLKDADNGNGQLN